MSTASGKTHAIYYIAALCTLPVRHGGVLLNGKSSAVLVFDNDGRFDAHRLRTIMKSHILQCVELAQLTIPERQLDDVAEAALHHVHIFRPQSFCSMIEMMKGTPEYLLDLGSHNSAQRRLDAILLDGMSSFYWQDRSEPERRVAAYPDMYHTIVNYLRAMSTQFGAFIVATNWGLHLSDAMSELSGTKHTPEGSPMTVGTGRVAFRSHLPPSWGKFVNVKLVLERSVIGWGTSIQNENEAKQLAVNQHDFCGWIDVRGLSLRAQGIFRGQRITFHLKISHDRVTFEG
jgi:hypothetical protein